MCLSWNKYLLYDNGFYLLRVCDRGAHCQFNNSSINIFKKKNTILRDPKLNRHRFGDSTITIYSDALGEVS